MIGPAPGQDRPEPPSTTETKRYGLGLNITK